jgi:hypothetical protein
MQCTEKEWNTCRVEKMGCPGCYYDDEVFFKYNTRKEEEDEQEVSECTESKSD